MNLSESVHSHERDLFPPLGSWALWRYDGEVKTDLTTYGSLQQSQNTSRRGGALLKDKAQVPNKESAASVPPKNAPDYKVELSGEAKPLSVPAIPLTPPIPTPAASTPSTPSDAKKVPQEAKDLKKLEKLKEVGETKKETEKRPLIIFIKGMDVFSSPSKSEGGYAGVGKMAETIDGARIYGWDQQDEIIKEVSKIHRDYPVILVGHSLGGDTAMEVADELDSLEHKFRPVDLLVTIDSVGFNNDIVPQNVKNHLNVFGERNFFLNDDPHVARRHDLTKVKNILAPYEHTELDDNKEIQFEIVSLIQETLKAKA